MRKIYKTSNSPQPNINVGYTVTPTAPLTP
jgi:hypothetical protein